MRIRDLFENKDIDKDLQFIKKDGDKREIDYDLVEDLAFFMNHDDDTYRRHVYPAIEDCLDGIRNKKKVSSSIFANAVKESYKNYIKKYPLRELPDDLEEELYTKACKKMREDVYTHHEEGKYKD
jgi:hypothetical protein